MSGIILMLLGFIISVNGMYRATKSIHIGYWLLTSYAFILTGLLVTQLNIHLPIIPLLLLTTIILLIINKDSIKIKVNNTKQESYISYTTDKSNTYLKPEVTSVVLDIINKGIPTFNLITVGMMDGTYKLVKDYTDSSRVFMQYKDGAIIPFHTSVRVSLEIAKEVRRNYNIFK